MSDSGGDSVVVYIGTYTEQLPHVHGTAADGIYVCDFDSATGELRHRSTAGGVVNPSFVTVEPGRRFLYAVQEVGEFDGTQGGGVSAFRIDQESYALELINHQPTHGAHPCYVSLDESGRWLLVANYSGGNAAALPVAEDGSIGPAMAVVDHHDRGEEPHPHSIVAAPGNNVILVADAGVDQIVRYRLHTEQGRLLADGLEPARLAAGSGPRHVAFHPNAPFMYAINEQGSSVTAFSYDGEQGTLRELQTVSTLPAEFTDTNSCADIHFEPSGRFLYGSNRGHDSIARFAVDERSGEPRLLGHTKTGGKTPRNFGVDPSGRFLLAANQDSDTVVTFRIDQATGDLAETGIVTRVPAPVCVCFVSF